MKLDVKTTQVVKNFSTINQSLRFRKGKYLKTMSPSKTVIAKAALTQEFDRDFAIYDLSKFLSALSLFKEPELDLEDKWVKIHSGAEHIQYTYADPSMLVVPPENDLKLPSLDVQFTLTQEALKSLQTATSVLGVPEIAVVGKNGRIALRAIDSKSPTSDTYSLDIGETDKTFQVVFKAEYFKLLPQSYEVSISRVGYSHFKGESVEYWLAIEAKESKFG